MNLNPLPTNGAVSLQTDCCILRPLSALYCTSPEVAHQTFAFDENCSAVAFLCLAPGGRLVAPFWTCAPGARSGVLGFFDGASSLEAAQEMMAEWFAPLVDKLKLGTVAQANTEQLALATRKLLDDPGTMGAWLDELGASGVAGIDEDGKRKHLRTLEWGYAAEYAENLLSPQLAVKQADLAQSIEKQFFYEALPVKVPGVSAAVQYLLTLAAESLPEGLMDLADKLDYQSPLPLQVMVEALLERLPHADVASLQKALDEGFTPGPLLQVSVQLGSTRHSLPRNVLPPRRQATPTLLKLPLRYPLASYLAVNLEGFQYDLSGWIRSFLVKA